MIECFSKNGKVSYLRVLFWSLITAHLAVYASSFINLFFVYNYSPTARALVEAGIPTRVMPSIFDSASVTGQITPSAFIYTSLAIGVVSSLIDLWSIWIAKQIYVVRKINNNIVAFLLDLTLSSIPVAALGYATAVLLVFQLLFNILSEKFGRLTLAFTEQLSSLPQMLLISVFLLFFVRLAALVLGILFRFLLSATKLNRYTVLHTNFSDYPFTFFGFIAAIMSILVGLG